MVNYSSIFLFKGLLMTPEPDDPLDTVIASLYI